MKTGRRLNDFHCIILLCVFNGGKHLNDQLQSIQNQSFKNWTIVVSDDGSTDGSLDIIKSFQSRVGKERMLILDGPRKGYAKNFHYACQQSLPLANYFAFCDQDDIWESDKLAKAIKYLKKCPDGTTGLFATRTTLVDASGQFISLSKTPSRRLTFNNAIIENIAGGNTMVFNRRLAEMFCLIPIDVELISHDWTVYQIATASEGHLCFDSQPSVQYRQHANNIIGSNQRTINKFRRLLKFSLGCFKNWMDVNLNSLSYLNDEIPHHQQLLLKELTNARAGGLCARVRFIINFKIYRQAHIQSLIFKIGFIFGKV